VWPAYWPAAYFGLYLPLIAPHEAWALAHAAFALLSAGYVIGLLVTGVIIPVGRQLMCAAAIAASVTLLLWGAGVASLPGFHKAETTLAGALDVFERSLAFGAAAMGIMLLGAGLGTLARRRLVRSEGAA